ncbi:MULTISPECIES: sporulation protein YunB [Intestinimonas]
MGVTLYMRTWHRWGFPRFRRRGPPQARKAHGLLLSGLLGVSLALLLIGYLEIRLHPILNAMATAKVTNTVTQTLDGAIANEISSVGITYGDLISMEKDSTGRVTALTSNMAELNRLRTSILSAVVTAVDTLDQEQLAIPVGNLTGINFLSGRGISLPVEVVAVGSAHAEFHNQFDYAGINQTRHQILLDVSVAVDILLPGDTLRTEVTAQVPVAETVIVGAVPDTYLQLGT